MKDSIQELFDTYASIVRSNIPMLEYHNGRKAIILKHKYTRAVAWLMGITSLILLSIASWFFYKHFTHAPGSGLGGLFAASLLSFFGLIILSIVIKTVKHFDEEYVIYTELKKMTVENPKKGTKRDLYTFTTVELEVVSFRRKNHQHQYLIWQLKGTMGKNYILKVSQSAYSNQVEFWSRLAALLSRA